MPKVDLPCPECGRLLRLPDRSLLGRKGKCGKCGHKFILREPKTSRFERTRPQPPRDIHFESLDEPAAGGSEDSVPKDDETLAGIAARYVPDHSANNSPGAAAVQP